MFVYVLTFATSPVSWPHGVRKVATINKQAQRIDRMLRRESCGRFRNLRHLITTPGYTPTLRRAELADAYDAAQAARGDPRRACR